MDFAPTPPRSVPSKRCVLKYKGWYKSDKGICAVFEIKLERSAFGVQLLSKAGYKYKRTNKLIVLVEIFSRVVMEEEILATCLEIVSCLEGFLKSCPVILRLGLSANNWTKTRYSFVSSGAYSQCVSGET
jgi:hypothetical protein